MKIKRYLFPIAVLMLLAVIFTACHQTPVSDETQSPATEAAPAQTQSSATEAAPAQTQSSATEAAPDQAERPKIEAPDFTVYTADGDPVRLSDFEGKPVVLNFWATWCGPCKYEMPGFDETFLELGEEIAFVMVNLTDGTADTVESVQAFLEQTGYEFPVYYDTAASAATVYGVSSIPMTLFIDADGYAIAHASRAIDKELLMVGIDMIR